MTPWRGLQFVPTELLVLQKSRSQNAVEVRIHTCSAIESFIGQDRISDWKLQPSIRRPQLHKFLFGCTGEERGGCFKGHAHGQRPGDDSNGWMLPHFIWCTQNVGYTTFSHHFCQQVFTIDLTTSISKSMLAVGFWSHIFNQSFVNKWQYTSMLTNFAPHWRPFCNYSRYWSLLDTIIESKSLLFNLMLIPM